MKGTDSHQVSIILISYNLGPMTRECVESIQRNVTLPYEIILVDNGSGEETVRILKELKGMRLFCNHENAVPDELQKRLDRLSVSGHCGGLREAGGKRIPCGPETLCQHGKLNREKQKCAEEREPLSGNG